MKTFDHIDAKTVAEASAALANDKGVLIAGGTDLLGQLKDDILPTYTTRTTHETGDLGWN
jgi:xanthine dehydrogenase YagS FAD-binding subunit